MESKNIAIVYSTRTMESANEMAEKIKNTCGFSCDIYAIINTEGIKGLSTLYNENINGDLDENGNHKHDIFVFIHDDIDFLKQGWAAEINRLFEEHKDYGIIGVDGSAEFDEMGMWWNYPKKYGQVLHRHDGKSWLTAFSPLLDKDLEEVCVVDGLFIAVQVERISHLFDENYKFNYYDIAFCLLNFLEGKTKIGVTTNIRIAHNSIGELRQEWYDNREKIRMQFGDFFPIELNVKKRKK